MSEVRIHFVRSEDLSTSKCKYCNVILRCGSTTSSLWNHIRMVHGTDPGISEWLAKQITNKRRRNNADADEDSGEGPSLDDTDEDGLLSRSSRSNSEFNPPESPCKKARRTRGSSSPSTRNLGPLQAEVITQAIAKMVALDQLPFSHVEGEGFKHLMSVVAPSYKVPCAKTILNRVHLLHNEKKEIVKKKLAEAEWLALDCDSWTSLSMESYTTVNAHYIDAQWKKQTLTLSTKDSEERHTSANLAKGLQEVVDDFGIQKPKICACVTDNAVNVTKAAEEFIPDGNVRCASHTIQLCVQEGLKQPIVKTKLDKASLMVGHFRHSTLATVALHNRQKQLIEDGESKLVQRCPTRWNSDYYMCASLRKNKTAINAVIGDRSVTKSSVAQNLEMSDSDWLALEEIEKVCKPLEISTRLLCSSAIPTISMVRPIVHSLLENHLAIDEDNEVAEVLKSTISDSLKTRFGFKLGRSTENVSIEQLASVLDPRYRSLSHEDREDRYKILAELELQCLSCETDFTAEPQENSTENQQQSRFEAELDFLFQKQTQPKKKTVSEEVENFRNGIEISNVDCLQWWQSNEEKYPRISKLAKKYLCIPATSAAAERVFSTAGNIVSAKRNCLDPSNVNELVFLFQNKKQF